MDYPVKDAITKRRSVRTYNGKPLFDEDRIKIEEYLKTLDNPFGVPVEFRLLDGKKYKLSSPVVLGTDLYVGGKTARVTRAEEAFGYVFEKFVLYATSIGLGTVWIAGTMNRAAFEKAMEVGESEIMVAVSPIGYPAEKKSIRETLMRKAIKADSRLPFEALFFKGSFDQPLASENCGPFKDMLEMVRLSPSAVNKQPWRAVVCGDTVHFFEKKSKGFAHGANWDIQRVDVGIALCHFALTAEENGVNGRFIDENPNLAHDTDTEYIISYKLD